MKDIKILIDQIQQEKTGWSDAEVDSWIEKKMAELEKAHPYLYKFLKESKEEIFKRACHEAPENMCPAEAASRYLLLKLLEVIELFKAKEEIEKIELLFGKK